MKPLEWRERRFVEGSAALRRYLAAIGKPDALPPTGEYYVCPCCMRVYGREALSDGTLTIEDVHRSRSAADGSRSPAGNATARRVLVLQLPFHGECSPLCFP